MSDLPESQARVVRLIHLAMMVSAVIYPLVIVIVLRTGQLADQTPVDDPTIFFVGALALAGASLLLSFWLPTILASDAKIEQALRDRTAPGESPSLAGAYGVLFPTFIMKLALLESISIFGLVLSFLTQDESYVIGFSVVALIFMAMARLDTERAEEICRRIDRS